ncbi:hypothetical protein B7P43_G06948 [Cryptotermes secundus]|uniref:Uncharacterized protein n=1 Tax=Cryptotermes secundus TaxID=105785 RepID=A0A2J7QN35_9NEOP|nr:hypothetical protein B7P43_G06948 [Cryptotermes secundus]
MGFGLVTHFIDHLQITAASSYGTITNLHTLQITRARAKSQSFIVFPSHCLVTALNKGDSSASVLMPLPAG